MQSCGMAKKQRKSNPPSGYALMWVLVMFDLPVASKKEMRLATQFRNSLQELGFVRKQLSVYIRHCETLEKAQALATQVGRCLTENGSVSVMFITDRQYGMTQNYFGKARKRNAQEVLAAQGQLFLY